MHLFSRGPNVGAKCLSLQCFWSQSVRLRGKHGRMTEPFHFSPLFFFLTASGSWSKGQKECHGQKYVYVRHPSPFGMSSTATSHAFVEGFRRRQKRGDVIAASLEFGFVAAERPRDKCFRINQLLMESALDGFVYLTESNHANMMVRIRGRSTDGVLSTMAIWIITREAVALLLKQ